MPQKPDYYEVLGVARTASVDEIKSAFKRIAMKCHPDMLRDKTAAEKKTAEERFQWAREAQDVLTDPARRSTYDRLGHAGLEGNKGGATPPSGTPGKSWADAVGTLPTGKMPTNEEVDDFFHRRAGGDPASSAGGAVSGESAEERRNRAAEERRKRREEQRGGASAPSAADDFRDVAEDIEDIASGAKGNAVSLAFLEKLRDDLRRTLRDVEAAIDRARKNGGPQP